MSERVSQRDLIYRGSGAEALSLAQWRVSLGVLSTQQPSPKQCLIASVNRVDVHASTPWQPFVGGRAGLRASETMRERESRSGQFYPAIAGRQRVSAVAQK